MQTVLCYLEKEGQYLMLHRTKKKDDINAGKWIGVGGKIEVGETPEAALLREVKEETGLTLTQYHFRGVVEFCSDIAGAETMHLYTANAWEGTLCECDEGELRWIAKSELHRYPLWEGDAVFLEKLSTDCPPFRLRLQYKGEHLIGHQFKECV